MKGLTEGFHEGDFGSEEGLGPRLQPINQVLFCQWPLDVTFLYIQMI